MSIGLTFTKSELDQKIGHVSLVFKHGFEDAVTLKAYFDSTTDQILIDMGYTAGEVATIKTAFTDLNQLSGIWLGNANLAAAKNFTQFVSRLWGTGL